MRKVKGEEQEEPHASLIVSRNIKSINSVQFTYLIKYEVCSSNYLPTFESHSG
jgi:hypothetical protein